MWDDEKESATGIFLVRSLLSRDALRNFIISTTLTSKLFIADDDDGVVDLSAGALRLAIVG